MRDYEIMQAYYHGSRKPGRRSRFTTAVATIFLSLFAAGGIFFGCIFASTLADVLGESSPVRQVIPSLSFAAKPSAVAKAPPATAKPGEPAATPTDADPFAGVAPWTSSDRITILLLGLDQRTSDRGMPTRSDTMILVTVDPVTKRAGMLSIPRDLWVPIPGYGENKINTAHFFGEAEKPGNGPALAKKTVEYNFGVHVNYYARVDFKGFEELMNAIGGVTIDVERPIKDDEYPASNEVEGGIVRVYIPSGLQHLSGQDALRYARSRHSDNDFNRNRRQQSVLVAARQQVLQPATLPKIPQLLGILYRSLQTDVPITDVLPLFNATRGIEPKDLVSRSIDSTVSIDVNGDGTVFVPDRKKIRVLMEEVFGSAPAAVAAPPVVAVPTPIRAAPTARPTVVPTSRPTATPTKAATATPARVATGTVSVYNGTLKTGFAAGVADALRAKGFSIKMVGQARRSDYKATIVQDHTRKGNLAANVAYQLGVPSSAVLAAEPSGDGVDVTVILGPDAKVP